MGHMTNEYFSTGTVGNFKEDPNRGAYNCRNGRDDSYVAAALNPFLPELSTNMFALFGEVSGDSTLKFTR